MRAISIHTFMNATADIEYSEDQNAKATHQEVTKNRACLKELSAQGCGDPGDDHQQFLSCLKNVHSTLSTDCQKMMTNLYELPDLSGVFSNLKHQSYASKQWYKLKTLHFVVNCLTSLM